jgi:rhamnogalacturonan acetylesterase
MLGGMRVPLLIATILCAASAFTQTAAPPTPPVPVQTHVTPQAPLNPALPTLFIVGDSTARNQMDLGWADHLAPLFDTTKINLANRAIAGRSSRTYYNEGRWDQVVAQMKPGDYVVIQMGHNDGGFGVDTIPKDSTGRGSIKGLGDETVDVPISTLHTNGPLAGKTTETIHTYGWYIRKYIADARAKGANPILMTVTIRNIWKDGHIERDMGFRDFDMKLAAEQHVPIADMARVEADALEKLGPEATALLFPIDHTHTSAQGAELNAGFVVESLKQIHSPLVSYMKP